MKINNLQLKPTTITQPKVNLRQLSDEELTQIIGGARVPLFKTLGGAFDTELTLGGAFDTELTIIT